MFFIMHQINNYEEWGIRTETMMIKTYLKLHMMINKTYLKIVSAFL